MNVILDHQLALIAAAFLLGCLGAVSIRARPMGSRAWKIADLLWVVLGGLGALTAVVAGIYQSDSSRLDRQIDVAYAATSAFDRDAARFRLSYCEQGTGPQLRVLCDRAEFLSASTANNADLPLFIAITEAAAPLSGLRLVLGAGAQDTRTRMQAEAASFDPAEFLVFAARDAQTQDAIDTLRRTRRDIAADYQVLAQSYEDLITQVTRLKAEWEFLQDNAGILVLQILALCMVAFAAPYRLGKSLAELR